LENRIYITAAEILSLIVKRFVGNALLRTSLAIDVFNGNKNLIKNSNPIRGTNGSVALIAAFCNSKKEYENITNLANTFLNEQIQVIIINNGNFIPLEVLKGTTWLQRKNQGRDFGAWKDVLSLLDSDSLSEVILINDTCEWNNESLMNFLKFARASAKPVICATESHQKTRHMQSYILVFKSDSINELFEFFTRVKNWRFKRTIVSKGEIGLSRHVLKKGLDFAVWVPFTTFALFKMFKSLEVQVAINPVNFLHREINHEFKFKKINHLHGTAKYE
jgi:hypothetical protein